MEHDCISEQTLFTVAGFAAGSYFSTPGGAADFICLADDPTWGVYDDNAQPYPSKIYGVEYQLGDQFADGGEKLFGQDIYQQDVPCAVCRTTRPTNIMIPGRNQCYPGWTMEYSGYLISDTEKHPAATNYACLDVRPEVVLGGQGNDNGKLVYVVEGVCGTLKCPPYVNNREITCVVCSK